MEKLEYFKELYTKALTTSKNGLALEAYPKQAIVKILRSNLMIHFKNKEDKDICVYNVFYGAKKDNIYLRWCFTNKREKTFLLKLNSFLYLYKRGEFHDVQPAIFAAKYLVTLETKLNAIELAMKKKSEPELEKTVRAASTRAHSSQKNAFTDNLSLEEQAQLTGWILHNMYSIHLYGLADDPHHAYIYLNSVEGAPVDLFSKVLNRPAEKMFNGKRLNDTEFVREFYRYIRMFMPYIENGDRKISKYIHPDAPEFLKQYGEYYNAFLDPFLPF